MPDHSTQHRISRSCTSFWTVDYKELRTKWVLKPSATLLLSQFSVRTDRESRNRTDWPSSHTQERMQWESVRDRWFLRTRHLESLVLGREDQKKNKWIKLVLIKMYLKEQRVEVSVGHLTQYVLDPRLTLQHWGWGKSKWDGGWVWENLMKDNDHGQNDIIYHKQ